jgi:hypothetical protein
MKSCLIGALPIALLLQFWAGSASAFGEFPARLTICAQDSDCCGVRGECGGWVFVNAKYGSAAREQFRRLAMAANCARSEEAPAPAAACLKGSCAGKPGSGGACRPSKEAPPSTAAGVIEGLSAPVAGLREQAALGALKLGPRAKAAVPALIKALRENEAYWSTFDQTKHDMLGYEDLAGPYLNALTAIGADAAAAVPAAAAMLGDERRGVHKDAVLTFLKAMGPKAGAALPALLKMAELGPGRGESHDSLAVIAALAAAAASAAPRVRALLPAFEKRRDTTGYKAAMAALSAIEPGSGALADELRALGSQDLDILAQAIAAVGRRGAAAKAAVPGLIKIIKGNMSYPHLRIAAYGALAKIGAPPSEAAPIMLADYLGQSDAALKQASAEALARLDKKGEAVIPLLGPALESPYQVRDAVELLERMDSPRAAALAEATRRRWKLR